MAIVEQDDGHRDINLRDPDREQLTVDLYPLDLELFKAQRESLRFVISEGHYSGDVIQEHLEGLECLLDEIWDQLVPVDHAS